MMQRSLVLGAVLIVCANLPSPVRAALVCDVGIASLDFGMISVRDGLSQQTSGPVTIACSGGTPGTTAKACVTIGSGSGGSGPGQSPREMIGDGTAPLYYQLTAQNSFSGGGSIWQTVGYDIPLDATGSATFAPTLYAEVTSIGSQVTTGSYSSRFDAGTAVSLAYGETDCNESGAASAFTVSATVTASCTVTVSNMNFGFIDTSIVAPVDQTATIDVSCTNGSGYTVGIGSGLQPVDAGPTGRRMANGANLLAYGLYRDPSRMSDWGVTPATVATGTGTGGNQSLTVFGRIFGSQSTSIGNYSDSVVVIVTY
jgi:spore coat protein U-like protein